MTPFVLPTQDGALYLSIYSPYDGERAKGWVLHLPAFAEEMNRSRLMVSHQARSLAERGFTVVVPDLLGTGDSDGEFADAGWPLWRRNAVAVLQWMESMGAQSVSLWGLRLGGLLALDLASTATLKIRQVLLWQPVLSGSVYVQQLLRQFALSPLAGSSGESVSTIRQRLNDGESIELGGYTLSPALVAEISELTATRFPVPDGTALTWIDVTNAGSAKLHGVAAEYHAQLAKTRPEVDQRVVAGPSFWAAQETTLAPTLIDVTTQVVDDSAAAADANPSKNSRSPSPLEHAIKPVVFPCGGDELVGILHKGDKNAELAVVFLVGGPQYRVGAHRQFVHLARSFSAAGIPAFRFDFRGMGDSSGVAPGFAETQDDIDSAINALQRELPSIKHIVLWGLCDGATAASLYAGGDPRIKALILANPWLHTESGQARTYLKHYYPRRLASRDFWRQVFTGRLHFVDSLTSFYRAWRLSVSDDGMLSTDDLTERVRKGLSEFAGPIFLLLSEHDLTAAEFCEVIEQQEAGNAGPGRSKVARAVVQNADHTFSSDEWKDRVSDLSIDWVRALASQEVV